MENLVDVILGVMKESQGGDSRRILKFATMKRKVVKKGKVVDETFEVPITTIKVGDINVPLTAGDFQIVSFGERKVGVPKGFEVFERHAGGRSPMGALTGISGTQVVIVPADLYTIVSSMLSPLFTGWRTGENAYVQSPVAQLFQQAVGQYWGEKASPTETKRYVLPGQQLIRALLGSEDENIDSAKAFFYYHLIDILKQTPAFNQPIVASSPEELQQKLREIYTIIEEAANAAYSTMSSTFSSWWDSIKQQINEAAAGESTDLFPAGLPKEWKSLTEKGEVVIKEKPTAKKLPWPSTETELYTSVGGEPFWSGQSVGKLPDFLRAPLGKWSSAILDALRVLSKMELAQKTMTAWTKGGETAGWPEPGEAMPYSYEYASSIPGFTTVVGLLARLKAIKEHPNFAMLPQHFTVMISKLYDDIKRLADRGYVNFDYKDRTILESADTAMKQVRAFLDSMERQEARSAGTENIVMK